MQSKRYKQRLWVGIAGVTSIMVAPLFRPAHAAQVARVDEGTSRKGSVIGRVVDAATGHAVDGRVSAFAECRGTGCQFLPEPQLGAAQYPATRLRGGTFTFDAYSSKPAQLELGSQGYLLVRAEGYQPVAVAHTPRFAADAKHPAQRNSEVPTIALCKVGANDQDRDGVCDDAERFYGANAAEGDTDADGIPDAIEINGYKNSTGTGMFDLKGDGALPSRKDVFVHLDYTAGQALSDAALNQVKDAFAKSPHDGKRGILLHVLKGQQIPSQGDIRMTPDHLQAIRAQYFPEPYTFPFHYALSTEFIAGRGASGVSPEIPGLNFAVALKGLEVPRTSLIEAGTFMHELGHNLGLQHGGADPRNRKPNYLSVMNYLYQWDGLQRGGATGVIDYARFRVGEVSEAKLSGSAGFPIVTSPVEPLDDVITVSNPNYCRRRARKDDCATGQLTGQVPGAITFSGVPRCWSSRRCDLDGNGLHGDTFLAVQNDWAAIKFDPAAVGVIRVVTVEEDAPCPLPGNEEDAPTDELDEPEAGETTGSEPPTDQLPEEEPGPGEEVPSGDDENDDDDDEYPAPDEDPFPAPVF